MSYALVQNSAFVRELMPRGSFVDANGIATGWDRIIQLPDEQRRAMGIYVVQEVKPAIDSMTQALSGPTYAVAGAVVTKTWAAVARNFADTNVAQAIRDAAWSEVKAWRAARVDDPFQWNGKWYDGDTQSREFLNGAVNSAQAAIQTGGSFSETWTAADDSQFVITNAAMMQLFASQKAAQISALFSAARVARSTIEVATTAQACRDAVTAFKTTNKAIALLDATAWAQHQQALATPGYVADPFTTYVQI